MTREEAIEELEKLKRYVEPRFYRDGYLVALDMAIEALSAEPTDLISRAEVLDIIAFKRKLANIDGRILLDEIEDRINALPSADRQSGEWKPASEELPQRVGSYIVTCIGEHGSVYVDYDYWTVADKFKYNRDKVTAWIPFPKPYEGGENE